MKQARGCLTAQSTGPAYHRLVVSLQPQRAGYLVVRLAGKFHDQQQRHRGGKRVNNVIVTKRRSHKAASQDWGRASRYALIRIAQKAERGQQQEAPLLNMGIQRTRIPASRYPFGHSGPLIPSVRLPYSPVILLLNISIAILFHPGLFRLSIALILLILVEFFFIIHLLVASILL